MRLLAKFGVIFDRGLYFMFILAASIIGFMMLAVCFGVFSRYVLNQPQVWVIEVSGFGLLYVTFLGAAWVLREEGHTILDLVLTRLNPRNQALANVINSILGTMACLVVVYYGAGVTWECFQRGEMADGFLDIPLWISRSIILIGSLLLSVQFVKRTCKYWSQMEFRKKEEG